MQTATHTAWQKHNKMQQKYQILAFCEKANIAASAKICRKYLLCKIFFR